jgi:hypothetical protein
LLRLTVKPNMSKTDWTYVVIGGMVVVWVIMHRLDRLGKQSHYFFYRLRQEMAELLGKREYADQLRREWNETEKERKKEERRDWIVGTAIICAVLIWIWFTSQH